MMKNLTRVMHNDKSLILILVSLLVIFCRNMKLFNIDIFLPLLVCISVSYFSFYIIRNKDYSVLSITTIIFLIFLIGVKLYYS